MVPEWAKALPWPLIREKAEKYRLSPELVAAVVQTESAGNVHCIRAEVKKTLSESGQVLFVSTWRYFEEPDHFAASLKPACSSPTEWVLQACGIGPMQVQGGVAREHGFAGWLTELCSWETGVEYGCRHLRKKADRYGDDPATLYAAYNGGSPRKTATGMFENQRNVDRFMALYRELVP
jgi:soluble lytic murein transglycosylase-like protein